ncbi:MAG: CaiB/BaiF CoA transferase family protein [Vicinamibacterales bacterium]
MGTTTRTPGPLAGLRLIECGSLLAGPFCGQLFGDFGAEVIKVEAPDQPDPLRGWGQKTPIGKSLWWPVVARNKKAITLNLREREGQLILRELVAKSDFLLENFRPGTMEKWGLGYDSLAPVNPGLIMIRVSGYGQSGPYSSRAGYGAVGEAMGGLRYIVGDPATPPSRVGISIGDSLAATFAFCGALAALNHRHNTGRGQIVDSAIYEAVLNMMECLVSEYDKIGYIRERTGSILPKIAPSSVYPTADGSVLIAGNGDAVFARLAAAMGQPELARDPRYATHAARGERQRELDDLIGAWSRQHTADHVLELMERHAVPAGRIYRAPEMLADPHFQARESIVKVPNRHFGEIKMQNVAPKLSETPGSIRSEAPEVGEHNDEIYRGVLGYDDARLADLRARGII